MKRKYTLRIAFLMIILSFSLVYTGRAIGKKPLTYINAIDKVYNSNISGINQ